MQPPQVEVGHKRIAPRTYKFDVSETVVMNAGMKIINMQWDFDYGKRFSRIDSNDVQHKRNAAEMWCKQRSMEYILATGG